MIMYAYTYIKTFEFKLIFGFVMIKNVVLYMQYWYQYGNLRY